jgi:CDGSH-type Zn-finger protein
MARLVRHDAHGPIVIEPQKESIFVCACGLSQTMPYCDGSHDNTMGEKPGKVCVYDKTRTKVVEVKKED